MTTTHTEPPRTTSAPISLERRFGAAASVVGGVCLLVGFLVVPGPDVADVHQSGWVPGHSLHVVGFLLLALGLPAIAGSLGPRLGVPGIVGYAAVMTRYVLSAGSHLYSLWILPTLATHPELHQQAVPGGKLASVYAGHGNYISAGLGVAMLGLVYALARCGHGLRVVAALIGLAGLAEFVGTPFGLMLLAVVGVWLGTRLLLRGDITVPLSSKTFSVRANGPLDHA